VNLAAEAENWGNGSTYHLTINTTEWNIKELAPAAAEFVIRWFRR